MEISMTQKEKKLLLKDLCARLPYGVKCLVNYTFCNETTDYEDVKASDVDTLITINQQTEDYFFEELSQWFDVDEFKPYLFPLSSMTEEQKIRISAIQDMGPSYYHLLVDRYNEWHIDYRGLIGKGLAIDATNLNIYK